MAIPSEYNDSASTIGSTDIKHPIISFRVIKQRPSEESIGPITNSKSGAVLHPDLHQDSPDRGRAASENHETQYHQFIPGFLRGENIAGDGTFTAYGHKATYLKQTYADVPNPMLVVTNSPPYTSA